MLLQPNRHQEWKIFTLIPSPNGIQTSFWSINPTIVHTYLTFPKVYDTGFVNLLLKNLQTVLEIWIYLFSRWSPPHGEKNGRWRKKKKEEKMEREWGIIGANLESRLLTLKLGKRIENIRFVKHKIYPFDFVRRKLIALIQATSNKPFLWKTG